MNESSKSGTLEKRETTQDLKGDGKKKSQSNLKTIRLWVFVIICFLIPLVTSWNSIVFYFNHKYGKLSFASHTNGDSSSFLSTSSESDSL